MSCCSQSYQNMDSEGVFYQMPYSSDGVPLQPLEVTLFNNSYDKDKFENTAWTLNGKFGDLKVGVHGRLSRPSRQPSGRLHELCARRICRLLPVLRSRDRLCRERRGRRSNLKPTCFSPSATWQETERNEHMSNEIRLSTPDDWRWRGIVGVFNEQNKLFDQTDWLYKTIPACTSNEPSGGLGNTGCLSDIGTATGATTENPGVQNDNVAFFEDTQREVKQTAVFGSVDFDIIPKVLTVTAGTRHYRFDNSFTGSVTGSFYCFEQGNPAGGCLNDSTNLNAKT